MVIVIVNLIIILKVMAVIRIKFFLLLMVPKFNGQFKSQFLHFKVPLRVQLT